MTKQLQPDIRQIATLPGWPDVRENRRPKDPEKPQQELYDLIMRVGGTGAEHLSKGFVFLLVTVRAPVSLMVIQSTAYQYHQAVFSGSRSSGPRVPLERLTQPG